MNLRKGVLINPDLKRIARLRIAGFRKEDLFSGPIIHPNQFIMQKLPEHVKRTTALFTRLLQEVRAFYLEEGVQFLKMGKTGAHDVDPQGILNFMYVVMKNRSKSEALDAYLQITDPVYYGGLRRTRILAHYEERFEDRINMLAGNLLPLELDTIERYIEMKGYVLEKIPENSQERTRPRHWLLNWED